MNERYFVADFETTVYEGQIDTQVWAAALVELYRDDVKIYGNIWDFFDALCAESGNVVCYFHNLKFDGSFLLSHFLVDRGYKNASEWKPEEPLENFSFKPKKEMKNGEISYSISDMGQWYRIQVKANSRIIEFRDSLKLLPFSVAQIGKAFKTQHQKLEMEYTGLRYPNCPITEQEREYIANDVLVIKEALEITFSQGHKKLTIGSCCMAEYKQGIGQKRYNDLFPDLYKMEISDRYCAANAGEYIRKSYRGGWCYLVKGKECKLMNQGCTADVNSLYPSMMSTESGNEYPVGLPEFFSGYIPDIAFSPGHYYFVHLRTRFYLKPGKLPFVQLKNTLRYRGTEMLETSDVKDPKTGLYFPAYRGVDGQIKQAIVEMTLTQTDYDLLREHYDLVDCTILDCAVFKSRIGIFDEYIEKYKQIKITSKGAIRELAKLFLNNLYGKMASSPDSSFKVAYVKADKSLGFFTVEAHEKKPGYIAVGSAITSYARNFTIRAAQKNFNGADKPGFVYADTDSIHCDFSAENLHGINVDPVKFCCWKVESYWDTGWFVRQKTYIEHVTHEDGEAIENPYYNVKCAGMPERSKKLFLASVSGEKLDKLSPIEQAFVNEKRTIKDFNIGLIVPGKLRPTRIRGGVLLIETSYEMR